MAKKTAAKKSSKTGKRAASSTLKGHCRSLPYTTEDVKWGDDLVFSVGGKMYAAFDLDNEDELAFKCRDEDFDRLTQIDGIIPAPYAARFGWVKVQRRGVLSAAETRNLLRASYDMVVQKLPAGVRKQVMAVGAVVPRGVGARSGRQGG